MSAKARTPARLAAENGPHPQSQTVALSPNKDLFQELTKNIQDAPVPEAQDAPNNILESSCREDREDSKSPLTPEVEVRATRSSSRKLTCALCRFVCKNTKEFTLHQKKVHADSKDHSVASTASSASSQQKTPARTRSSTRISKRSASPGKADEEDSKKPKFSSEGLKGKVLKKKQYVSAVLRSIKLKLTFKGTGLKVKKAQTVHSLDHAQVGQTTSSSIHTLVGEGTYDEVRTRPEEFQAKILEELPASASAKTSGNKDPVQKTTSLRTASLDEAYSMISTNGPGLASTGQCSDLHSMSGASEEEEDLGEDGRLVIDDSSGSNSGGGGLSAAGSGVLPTRCGNIQNRTYMCEDCEFTTTSAKQSLQHKKDTHGHDFTIYSCNLCDYATKYKQKLPRHYKLHFPTEGQVPDGILSSSSDAENATTPASTPSTTATPISTSHVGAGVKRTSSEAGLPSPHYHPHPHNPNTFSILPPEVILEEGEEEDGEEDEMVDSPITTPPPTEDGDVTDGLSSPVAAAMSAPPQKKKRKDVSPDKYFEVAEEIANTKYGCAICGNVYKWKKSLNKHWKEKHGNDPGDNHYTPPGMIILLQAQNHTQTEHRRCCHKDFLERITVKRASADAGDMASRPDTPHNFLNGHYNGLNLSREGDDVDGEEPLTFAAPPPIPVGPFVLGTSSQPVFPTNSSASGLQRQSLINSLHAPIPSSAGSILDLTTTTSSSLSHMNAMDEPDSVEDDDSAKPLDFTIQKAATPSSLKSSSHPTSCSSSSSSQGVSTEEDKEVSALNALVAASTTREGGAGAVPGASSSKDILKCPRCGEVLKTQTAYSNHMALHLQSANKRVAKCGVCQMHFATNETLNQHFLEKHLEHITSYKEAIQKIPHGLQQTYHLLKTPIHNIHKLASQETEDHLRCNMCEFTAKWPAELQKHAVSHSDERPFVCMVCGSTYKWKWDLVKHFDKAHPVLPNPYKRRESGASSNGSTPSALAEPSQGGAGASGSQDFEAEEGGEMSLGRGGKETGNNSSSVNEAVLEPSSSFLFDQGSSSSAAQDELSVEGLLRTSQQAGLMLSRQPNFLDGPEDMSGENPRTGNTPTFDLSSLQGMALPTSTAGLAFNGEDITLMDDGSSGNHGPIRSMRGHVKDHADQQYSMVRAKNGGKFRGPYKAYRTVEGSESSDLKYQCTRCEYKARWPSEIMQHMKNHSSEKPFGCPNCTYRSKWKWDVVKHLKRCGNGGSIKDVIDYSQKIAVRDAPPNVIVTPEGSVVQSQPQGANSLSGNEDPTLHPGLQASPFTSTSAVVSASQAIVNKIYQKTKAASEARNPSPSSFTTSFPSSSSSSCQNGSDLQVITSSGSASQQPDPPVTYTSLINEGQHHCLHCTFIAGSLAELRRHLAVHSDEKPFTCSECSYSTKWKCDMKKHKEKYKHNSPIVDMKKGEGKEENGTKSCPHCSFEASSLDALQIHLKLEHRASPATATKGETKDRFPCGQCSFSTNELASLISHRLQHQAKREQEESCQSPSGNTNGGGGGGSKEQDDARRKHPRKRYTCSKCDFICLTTVELIEHQKQAHGAHTCPFCPQRFDSKDDFLDHLTTHPEFQCTEFETYFNVNIYNEEDVNNNRDTPQRPAHITSPVPKRSKVTVVDMGSTANTIDLTTSTPGSAAAEVSCEWCSASFPNIIRLYLHASDVHPAQIREQEIAEGLVPSIPTNHFQPVKSGSKCLSPPLLSTSSCKESGKKATQKKTPSPTKLNGRLGTINLSSASNVGMSLLQNPAIMVQLAQQIQSQSRGGISGSSNSAGIPALSAPEMMIGLNLSTKKHQDGGIKVPSTSSPSSSSSNFSSSSSSSSMLFQCTKCAFRSSNLDDYQRHIQAHEVALAHLRTLPSWSGSTSGKGMRCWFCTEVFSSYPELYNHLASLHLTRMLERPQQLQDLMNKVGKELHIPGALLSTTSSSAAAAAAAAAAAVAAASSGVRRSDKNAPSTVLVPQLLGPSGPAVHQPTPAAKTIPTTAAITALPGSIQAQWLSRKKMLTYKGYPFKATFGQSQMWYHCLFCPNTSHDVSRVSEHTAQVHASSLPQKYRCGTCGQSSKKVQSILQHHLITHPNTQPDIHVLEFQEVTTSPTAAASLSRSQVPGLPQNSDISSLTMSMKGSTTDDLRRRKSSSVSHFPSLQISPVVKKESFSPPQAASSPVGSFSSPPSGECEPLDLSTEMVEDQHENREAGALEEEKRAQKVKEGQERMEEEVNNQVTADISKASSNGSMDLSKAAKEKEDEEGFKYQCKHCPFTCSSGFEFRVHASCHGRRSRYQCDLCSFSHPQLSGLQSHHTFHQGHPEYSFDFNPILNDTTTAAENMGKPSSPSSAPATKTLHCHDCPYKTTVKSSLFLHTSMHGQRCQYICDFCDWSTDRLVMVLQHRNIHCEELDFDPSPEDQVFANPEYAKVAPGEFEAKLLDSPAEEQPAASPSEPGQTPPFKLSITKKSYACPHCPYVTGSRTPYDFHLSQHDGAGLYPCEQCSYRTDSWGRLGQHSRVHEEHQKELQQQKQSGSKDDTSKKIQKPSGSRDSASKKTSIAIVAEGSSKKSLEGFASSSTATAALLQTSGMVGEKQELEGKTSIDKAQELPSLGCKANGTDAEDDESVEMAEFPDKEMEVNEGISNKNSKSSAQGESNTNTTLTATRGTEATQKDVLRSVSKDEEEEEELELQCERCPYRTTSRLLLSQHGKNHFSGGGPAQCPCCDFSCPSRQSLLVHVQLHFPSASQLDMDSLQAMLDSHGKSSPESGHQTENVTKDSSLNESKEKVGKSLLMSSTEVGEGVRRLGQEQDQQTTTLATISIPTPAPVRVYACRYCDREFEAKEVMLQHERQHKG